MGRWLAVLGTLVAATLGGSLSSSRAHVDDDVCLRLSEVAADLGAISARTVVHAGVTAVRSSRVAETPATARTVLAQAAALFGGKHGEVPAIYSGPRAHGPDLRRELAPERGKRFVQLGCEGVTVAGGRQYLVERSRSDARRLVLRAPSDGSEVTYTFSEAGKTKRLRIRRASPLAIPASVDCVPAQQLTLDWELVWNVPRNPLASPGRLRALAKLAAELDDGRAPSGQRDLCAKQRTLNQRKRAKKRLPVTAPF